MKLQHVGYRYYYLVWSLFTSTIPSGAKVWRKTLIITKDVLLVFHIHHQMSKILYYKGQ